MAEAQPHVSEQSSVEVIELNEAGLVFRVLGSGRKYEVAVNSGPDGEEIAVTELEFTEGSGSLAEEPTRQKERAVHHPV